MCQSNNYPLGLTCFANMQNNSIQLHKRRTNLSSLLMATCLIYRIFAFVILSYIQCYNVVISLCVPFISCFCSLQAYIFFTFYCFCFSSRFMRLRARVFFLSYSLYSTFECIWFISHVFFFLHMHVHKKMLHTPKI